MGKETIRAIRCDECKYAKAEPLFAPLLDDISKIYGSEFGTWKIYKCGLLFQKDGGKYNSVPCVEDGGCSFGKRRQKSESNHA